MRSKKEIYNSITKEMNTISDILNDNCTALSLHRNNDATERAIDEIVEPNMESVNDHLKKLKKLLKEYKGDNNND